MKPKRGPGYWKFNNSLLSNEEFCKEMNTLIETSWTEHSEIDDKHVRYELLKFDIQRLSNKISKQKNKIRRSQAKEFKDKLDKLYKK